MLLRPIAILSVCTALTWGGILPGQHKSKASTAKVVNPSATEDIVFGTRCGILRKERIVGGSAVAEYAIPWQVYLSIDERTMCGGSIISEGWILTAAHCVVDTQIIVVLAGRYNLGTESAIEQAIPAEEVFIHEEYNPVKHRNDIALIRLRDKLELNSHIVPVCLPFGLDSGDIFDGQTGTVSGWGSTAYTGPTPGQLQQVQLTLLGSESCRNFSKTYSSLITDQKMCAFENGKDACQGDSGGPLTWNYQGLTFQVGIVSSGIKGCGNSPGIYTKVQPFLNWIESKTGIE